MSAHWADGCSHAAVTYALAREAVFELEFHDRMHPGNPVLHEAVLTAREALGQRRAALSAPDDRALDQTMGRHLLAMEAAIRAWGEEP